jgi:hypothetical protein
MALACTTPKLHSTQMAGYRIKGAKSAELNRILRFPGRDCGAIVMWAKPATSDIQPPGRELEYPHWTLEAGDADKEWRFYVFAGFRR